MIWVRNDPLSYISGMRQKFKNHLGKVNFNRSPKFLATTITSSISGKGEGVVLAFLVPQHLKHCFIRRISRF